jgi:Recombinase
MHDMPTCKRIAIEEDRAGIFTDGFAPVAIFSAIGLLVSFLAIYFGAFG